jgi:cation diffusion facilitator family transporter
MGGGQPPQRGARQDPNGDRARAVSRRSLGRARRTGESRKTVIVALIANAVIALAKVIGGVLTGSAGMLAEAGHSLADTTNQTFLLVSIALGGREPTPERPFGSGQERFLWTFVAAVGMFLAGAVFAIGFGVFELMSGGGESEGFLVAYAILAVAFVAEGTSWLRARRQVRREAREVGKPPLRHARQSRDPNVKMVLFEDSAALVGVTLATAGIALNEITGQTFWDPLASILIGLLLVGLAIWMGRDARHLLIGSAALPEEREAIERAIEEYDEVDRVHELLTLVLGPNALLVAARIDLRDDLDSERVERVSTEIERRLREVVPDVTEVFLDATPTHGDGRAAPEEEQTEAGLRT